MEEKDYYMVTSEWIEVVQVGGGIATIANPNPQPITDVPVPQRANEYIDIHPLHFSLFMSKKRLNFAITWATKIDEPSFRHAQSIVPQHVWEQNQPQKKSHLSLATPNGEGSGN